MWAKQWVIHSEMVSLCGYFSDKENPFVLYLKREISAKLPHVFYSVGAGPIEIEGGCARLNPNRGWSFSQVISSS